MGETLRGNSRNTQEKGRNNWENMRKHHGKRQEMVRKLGKHSIEGITIIITQKTK